MSNDMSTDAVSTGRLRDKVAVIVGGGTGFGLATAQRFADEGATVVIVGRRAEVAAEAADGVGGTSAVCDITDFAGLEATTAQILEQHGRIDVGVNYAGYEDNCPIAEITPERFEPMVAVQFTGAVYFIRAMANAMSTGNGGSIISVSSLTAQNPARGHAAYAGSKAALEYVSQIAAVEYGEANVRVNCIAAHLIETPMTERIFERKLLIEAVKNQTPLGRMGHVDDIANCALFLASDEAGYISGETIRVDGAAFTQKLPDPTDLKNLAVARPDLL